MMLIPCPNCGPRNASEFRHAGDAPVRPDANSVTRAQWRSYLYDKRNPAGWISEVWYHGMGCRQFISVERQRTTNEIRPPSSVAGVPQSVDSAGDHADPSGLSGPLS